MLLEGALSLVSPVATWIRRDELRGGEGRIVACLGDSVTLGWGLPREEAWPARLEGWLRDRGVEAEVLNRAAGGSKIAHVVRRDTPWIAALPEGSRPIVLLMIGHNDLLTWAGMGGPRGRTLSPPGELAWEPRIFRLYRWVIGIARKEVPRDRYSVEDVETFAAEVVKLRQAAEGRGGELLLVTYLVPGPAPDGADAQWTAVLDAKRQHQLAINDLLRQVAVRDGISLIDLERGVPVPGSWDPAIFLDDVHLSAEGSGIVAASIGGWLLSSGRFDGG